MCRRVECSRCKRPTHTGCGAHVEQVLKSVPPADRCRCREKKSKGPGAESRAEPRSWFRGLLDGNTHLSP